MGNSTWLSNSLIGEVRWEGAIPQIRSFCEACGTGKVKSARLGGRKILISVENLEGVWSKEIADLFVSIDH